jgi:hypothetical protein
VDLKNPTLCGRCSIDGVTTDAVDTQLAAYVRELLLRNLRPARLTERIEQREILRRRDPSARCRSGTPSWSRKDRGRIRDR